LAACALVLAGAPLCACTALADERSSASVRVAEPSGQTAALPSVDAGPVVAGGIPASFAPLVDRVRDSVVELAGISRRNVVETIHATGVIVSASGHILTTDRVVRRGRDWHVTLADGTDLPSRLVGRDARSDLALLRVDAGRSLAPISLGYSDAKRPGDWVVAFGGGRGEAPALVKGTFTGRERERGRTGAPDLVIEMVVAGFGGSPLIDMHGHLVGVISGRESSSAGGGATGYAIPVEAVRTALATLEGSQLGEVSWLGVRLAPTAGAAEVTRAAAAEGALVNQVIEGSPAERAALRPGDLILSFNGQPVPSASALSSLVRGTPPRSEVALVVLRQTVRLELLAKLEPEPRSRRALEREEERPSFPGISYSEMNEELAARFSLPVGLDGVVISDITPGSRAWHVGLQLGDVIREVNRKPARTARDLRGGLRGGRALLLVQRGDVAYYVVLTPDP
jgi:serine protease Do